MNEDSSQIRNLVSFESDYSCSEENLGPCELLDSYLAERLNAAGYSSAAVEIYNFEWTFHCNVGDRCFLIRLKESALGTDHLWLLSVNSSINLLKRLFEKSDISEMKKLCFCIDDVLRRDEKIRKITWHTDKEWHDLGPWEISITSAT